MGPTGAGPVGPALAEGGRPKDGEAGADLGRRGPWVGVRYREVGWVKGLLGE